MQELTSYAGFAAGSWPPCSAARLRWWPPFQLVVLAGVALAMTTTGIVVTRSAGHTPYVVES